MTSRRQRTSDLITAALIAALMAASAWIAFPIGAVPVTLQTFIATLAALLLTPLWAGAALGVYVLMGAVGLPVFSQGQGGLGVLAGPTGGFLLGFVVGAAAGAWVRQRLMRAGRRQVVADVVGAAVLIGIVYALGVTQLAIVAGLGFGPAVAAGALPFIVPDLAKAAAAVMIAQAIRRTRTSRR